VEGSPLLNRWAEVDAIFSAAIDLEPSDRASYVEARCGDDVELRTAVTSLLSLSEEAGEFLEPGGASITGPSLARLAAELEEDAASQLLPADGRVGPYRLVREIGRGGSGSVSLAERDDGAFAHRVAIKLLRRGLDTDDILARFRAERQILASLNHPSIARLLDGGATEDGRPYLVMELVEGRPITEHCDEHRCTVNERLALFIQVVRAVEHAHGRLIVHRDIKPSNILVAADGTAKLLDFGISKLLDPSLAPELSPHTRTGVRLMTPEYASPEQIRGEPVSTASDTYQLGMLLYRLLTGRGPYRVGEPETSDLERVIREQEPMRASVVLSAAGRSGDPGPEEVARLRRTDLRRLRSRLRGDLDTILLKAVHKDPERRYSSAAAMADDLVRYLEGRPVTARVDSLPYRLRRLARRRPGAVAAALTLLLMTGGYVATLRSYTGQLESERNRAENALSEILVQRGRAEQTSDFVVSLFRSAQPGLEARGDTVSARTLLLRGADRIRSDLSAQPQVAMELLRTIGEIQYDLGMMQAAEELFDESVELSRELSGPDHTGVADNLAAIGRFHLARRAFPQAEARLAESLEIYRAQRSVDSVALAGVLSSLGSAHRETGRAEEAEKNLLEALALYRRHRPEDSREIRAAKGTLATVLRSLDRWGEAEPLYRELLQAAVSDSGTPPEDVASLRNNLAYLLRLKEEFPEAERLYRAALVTTREVYGVADRQAQVVAGNLASVLFEQGKIGEAESLLLEQVEIHRTHLPERHWRTGSVKRALAAFYESTGRPEMAEPWSRKVLAIYTEALGPDHAWTLASRAHLARSLTRTGRFREAESQLLTAFRGLQPGEQTVQRKAAMEDTLEGLVELHRARGDPVRAAHYQSLMVDD
jgi:eukaryotic-like serine/threonine-protein kinase